MRFVSVSGARGSGKTTLIRELVARLGAKGKRSAVIVNEEGKTNYDQDFVQSHGLQVKHIRGG